ncbi:hypothetical protein CYMTET_14781 [Cymbomonas tetramitiformis]|uniref:Uncharacterized protein n=1 Tax=Cymbomonas tetramitiformis TaxID=36881 RepID=A0AAE0GFT9_9CHLO|nr:hypothetical protein CYMTET_14781 [Cymbomonas tetramitiformis]
MSSMHVHAVDDAGEEQTARTWLPAKHVSTMHIYARAGVGVGIAEAELLRASTYMSNIPVVLALFVTFGKLETGAAVLCSPPHQHHRRCHHLSGSPQGEGGQETCFPQVEAPIPATVGVQGLVQLLLQHWGQVQDASWVQSQAASSKEQVSYWRLPWERGKLQSTQANDWTQLALGKLGCVPPEGRHLSGHTTRKGACTCARAVGNAVEICCFLGGWSQLSSAIHSDIDPTTVPDEHTAEVLRLEHPEVASTIARHMAACG